MSRSPTSRRPDYRWARFRRRYFARRVVYPWELPTIMRKHIYTGVMGSVYFYLIGGLFFVTFGNRIGLSRFQWGLMGGLSSFLLSAQLISALITRRAGRRKRLWFWCAVAGRSIRFVGIFLALLLWHLGWRESGVVLITAVCIANFFGAMAAPPWYSWLADIIPEEEHGGFWGRRSWWIGFWVVCTAVPLGFLLDAVGETYKLPVVTSIFFAASVVGLLDLVIHGTIPEPAMVKPPREHFLRHLIEPLRDRGFRPWLIFNGCWTFGMTLGGALATVYFVQELGIERNMKWGALVLMAFPLVGGW